MRKVLVFASLFMLMGASRLNAQKTVEYRESQSRLAEPSMGVYIKPLIADLELVDKAKGKIHDEFFFTMKEVNALGGQVPNLRARALFKWAEEHGADVIVAASFDIESKEDGSGYYVRVTGYPAKYVNWRTATATDNEWIHNENLKANQEKEQTQAISK